MKSNVHKIPAETHSPYMQYYKMCTLKFWYSIVNCWNYRSCCYSTAQCIEMQRAPKTNFTTVSTQISELLNYRRKLKCVSSTSSVLEDFRAQCKTNADLWFPRFMPVCPCLLCSSPKLHWVGCVMSASLQHGWHSVIVDWVLRSCHTCIKITES